MTTLSPTEIPFDINYNSSVDPIIVVGQVYIHPQLQIPVFITRVGSGQIDYKGVNFDKNDVINPASTVGGRADPEAFIEEFSPPTLDEVLYMSPDLKAWALSILPAGSVITQGYILTDEQREALGFGTWDGDDTEESLIDADVEADDEDDRSEGDTVAAIESIDVDE